ncbi:DNA polymerase [Desulfuromusa kysingii]|uniref:Type-4 uracil-DNA glycosylase n=1 Tax=Desulfuromusa kysingii TaxID=37625 RepID=A0A1H4BGY5_9BACT|nr:uracil-DNA glycosylase [Desulfuromusa kysingii]SEA47062.1 DNA polymerase [Desulfuromusa kysingii]
MSNELYHKCHEAISQGRAILEDLQQWDFETIIQYPQAEPQSTASHLSTTAMPSTEKTTLAEMESGLKGCSLCSLAKQRKNIVFGAGNPRARVVLVGEAPGREEDEQGIPFIGEAGKLLDKILLAMKLSREEVYICNVLKCHPPGNRDPQPDEISACEPFLKQQLALIKPELIITLGRFAAQELLKTTQPIGKLRGQWHEYEGIPLMPTFHPAYLLRNPSGKRPVWEDMKKVMQRLG